MGVAVGVGMSVAVEVGMVVTAVGVGMGVTIGVGTGVEMMGAVVGVGMGVAVVAGWEQPTATGRTKAMATTIAIAGFGTIQEIFRSMPAPNSGTPQLRGWPTSPLELHTSHVQQKEIIG